MKELMTTEQRQEYEEMLQAVNGKAKDKDTMEKKKNSVAQGLKVMSFIIVIIGVIAGLSLFVNQFYLGLSILGISIIGGMLVEGMSEIVQLLEDIKNK